MQSLKPNDHHWCGVFTDCFFIASCNFWSIFIKNHLVGWVVFHNEWDGVQRDCTWISSADDVSQRVRLSGVLCVRKAWSEFTNDNKLRWHLFSTKPTTCATSHALCENNDELQEIFEIRLIARSGNVNRPAKSLNLTPLDFFLWEFL